MGSECRTSGIERSWPTQVGVPIAKLGSKLRDAANLARALTRAGDCAAAYREADDRLRRQFKYGVLQRLMLSDEGEVTSELASPFDVILGEELRRA